MRMVLGPFSGCIALCLSVLTCSAADNRTIFILDATAQMNAKLGERRKIEWVKTTVNSIPGRVDATSSVALWAFGTDPKKKCEDTGELVPLQTAGSAGPAFDKALGPLQPKAARAPVFATLQAALKALGDDRDKPAAVVLIAGTGDDCMGDICATASKLHSEFPQAKLSVFGLGMGEQAASNYACAAKAMDGSFTALKSGTDLEKTLRTALNLGQAIAPSKVSAVAPAAVESKNPAEKSETGAAPSPGSPKEQPTQQETAEKPSPPQPPQPEPNTTLSAVLTAGMPPLDAGVTWEVFKLNTTPTGQIRTADAPSWTGGGGQAKIKLAEGRYIAHVSYGYASASGEFTVSGDKSEKTIALEAGTIAAEALQAREAPAADGAFFVLYRRKTAVALEELGRSSETPALFQVNAGDYVISALAGIAKLDTNVKVEAGKVSVVRMALNVGTLEIKTFAVEGSPKLIPAWHRVYSVASEPGKGGAPLLRIEGSSHRIQLPAGSYRLETIYGNAREESVVSITPGQVTSQSVILNAGEAKVNLPAGKSDRICAVYESGSERKADPAGRAAGSDISFILKAGLYDLECRSKGAPPPSKQTQIRVVAGETQSAKFEE